MKYVVLTCIIICHAYSSNRVGAQTATYLYERSCCKYECMYDTNLYTPQQFDQLNEILSMDFALPDFQVSEPKDLKKLNCYELDIIFKNKLDSLMSFDLPNYWYLQEAREHTKTELISKFLSKKYKCLAYNNPRLLNDWEGLDSMTIATVNAIIKGGDELLKEWYRQVRSRSDYVHSFEREWQTYLTQSTSDNAHQFATIYLINNIWWPKVEASIISAYDMSGLNMKEHETAFFDMFIHVTENCDDCKD